MGVIWHSEEKDQRRNGSTVEWRGESALRQAQGPVVELVETKPLGSHLDLSIKQPLSKLFKIHLLPVHQYPYSVNPG